MSTATQKAKMSSRHVLLIITGIMLTFGCSALTFSTWTNFQPVVSEAMGMVTSTGAIDTAPFALYITVLYLTMTVVSPMAGKLIQKMDIRIILSVSAALVGIAFILMSIYTEIWQFYISGVLLGLGEISILWLAIPTLMNRWFKKSAGFFIGICMAMTGVGGAIWNSLFTALNSSGTSYQTIYLIWGIVALATSLPFTLFCIRSTPEEVGLQPYGAEIAEDGTVEKAKGLSASKAMKSPVFYAVFIYAGIINFLTIIAPQFPSYMRSLGAAGTVAYDVAVVGGVMSVAVMVAQAISKVAMGGFADKNAKVTMITAFVAGVAGILLVVLGFSPRSLCTPVPASTASSLPAPWCCAPSWCARCSALANTPRSTLACPCSSTSWALSVPLSGRSSVRISVTTACSSSVSSARWSCCCAVCTPSASRRASRLSGPNNGSCNSVTQVLRSRLSTGGIVFSVI